MNYNWDTYAIWDAIAILLEGVVYTVSLTVITFMLSVIGGSLVCAMRMSALRPLVLAARVFTELMRLTPLPVQMLWVYSSLALATGIALSPLQAGIAALSMNSSAFLAEVFRSGVQSVPVGQRDAAIALGFSDFHRFRRAILPQALKVIIPPLGSSWVSGFKDTSLVAILGVPELMTRAQLLSSQTFRPLEVFTVTAALYLLLAYPQSRIVDRLYQRARRHEVKQHHE